MIDDKEMKELFRVESFEHLQNIENGLLQLEKNPENTCILQEVFREAHSLKGAARILALRDIEILSHRMEDILGGAHRKEFILSPSMISVLFFSLDSLLKLVEEATEGTPCQVDVNKVASQLKSLLKPDSIKQEAPKKEIKEIPVSTSILENNLSSEEAKENFKTSRFKVETIRVETQKMDILTNQAGEFSVTRFHIAERFSNIEEIIEKWEQIFQEMQIFFPKSPDLESYARRFSVSLEDVKNKLYEDHTRIEFFTNQIEETVRSIRLLSLDTLFSFFPRMVRELARQQNKDIEFFIEGANIKIDKKILEEMKDPLIHILTNAIIHGIESPKEREQKGKPPKGHISLKAFLKDSHNIVLEIQDDGRGLNRETIESIAIQQKICTQEQISGMSQDQIYSLIFEPGFSTSSFITEVSGRGFGLAVVKTNVAKLKGSISLESIVDQYYKVKILLPSSMTTQKVFILLTQEGLKYALPIEYIIQSFFINKQELFTIEGREMILYEGKAISASNVSFMMQYKRKDFLLPSVSQEEKKICCIILSTGQKKMALLVDQILEEKEIVLKPQCALLKHIAGISGATILGNGEICMVLNPAEFPDLLYKKAIGIPAKAQKKYSPKKILMVDDSITARILIKRILETEGYEVLEAVDGIDAFKKVHSMNIDAMVTDITMPRMDGLELIQRLRQEKEYNRLPVVLLSMLSSEEDKRKGLEVGANAYISKPILEQKLLLDTLRRLIPD